jgi:hypothetical protein
VYRLEDGSLLVHTYEWSHWQGEHDTAKLHRVTDADLGPFGQFAAAGQDAGFGRPMTLGEYFNDQEV